MVKIEVRNLMTIKGSNEPDDEEEEEDHDDDDEDDSDVDDNDYDADELMSPAVVLEKVEPWHTIPTSATSKFAIEHRLRWQVLMLKRDLHEESVRLHTNTASRRRKRLAFLDQFRSEVP
jgi:hypothetical protein